MSDYSAVNPPTEKNQSQAFAAALQRAKEVRNTATHVTRHTGGRARTTASTMMNARLRNVLHAVSLPSLPYDP